MMFNNSNIIYLKKISQKTLKINYKGFLLFPIFQNLNSFQPLNLIALMQKKEREKKKRIRTSVF